MNLINNSIPDKILDDLSVFLSFIYILTGNVKIDTLEPGMIYNSYTYTALPINYIYPYQSCNYEWFQHNLISDKPTIIANYLSDKIQVLASKPAELDIFTDLLYELYKTMSINDSTTSLVLSQVFLQLINIVSNKVSIIGPEPSDYKVIPYGL